MGRFARAAERAVTEVEAAEWLDRPGYRLEHAFALGVTLFDGAADAVRNALNGTWLGHPVHPPLTDVPIGAWTLALAFDACDAVRPGSPRLREAARTSVGVGLLGMLGAAVTGLADWQYTQDNARRLGLAHAAVNVSASALFASSWLDRRRSRHRRACAASTTGYLLVTAGAYLGGALVSRHRIGVDHGDRGLEPRTFVAVLDDRELPERRPRRVDVDGVRVVLVRSGGTVYALGEQCPHLGGPLSEGWLQRNSLVCPWHGSRFALDGGDVLRGPATLGPPCLETRTRAGRIEVRRIPPVPQATPGSVVAREQKQPSSDGTRSSGPVSATTVLRAHHDEIRARMHTLGRQDSPDRDREHELDKLTAEMSLHEQIEDEIFYPAMRAVSALVSISHAEHRQLDDQVGVVLRTGVHGDNFAEEFELLKSCFEHHAGLEESRMFPEVETKIDADRLDEIGRALADRLEQLRGSRLTRLRLASKRALVRRL